MRLIFASTGKIRGLLSESIDFRESMRHLDHGNRASARLGSMLWICDLKMRFRFKVTRSDFTADLRRLQNGWTNSLSKFCSLILTTVAAILWQCVASWPVKLVTSQCVTIPALISETVATAGRLYEFLCRRMRKDSRRRLISRVAAQSWDDDIRISVHFCTQRMLLTRRHLRRSLRKRSIERARARVCGSLCRQKRFDIAGIFVTFPFPLVIRAVAGQAERAYAPLRIIYEENIICKITFPYLDIYTDFIMIFLLKNIIYFIKELESFKYSNKIHI